MRSVIRRTGWILGMGFVVIAMAGDRPRENGNDDAAVRSKTEKPLRSDNPFMLRSQSADPASEDDDATSLPTPLQGERETELKVEGDIGVPQLPEMDEEDEEDEPEPWLKPEFLKKMEERMEAVDRAIVPKPFVIPDDPPPHEGALIDYPIFVEPTDLIQIEALEALPGRPISGEHLVRPDGTISLGFYGELHVSGLTTRQVKEKVVLHLRQYLTDEVLGLIGESPMERVVQTYRPRDLSKKLPETDQAKPGVLDAPPSPPESPVGLPPESPVGLKPLAPSPTRITPEMRLELKELLKTREQKANRKTKATTTPQRRRVHQVKQKAPDSAPVLVAPSGGNVKITIEVQGSTDAAAGSRPEQADELASPESETIVPNEDFDGIAIVDPKDSDRVLVNLTAYNSQAYYVQGDVAAPGRLPFRGADTVLDVINYAGGLAPTADIDNINLIRPARAGKPRKTYRINFKAILDEADAESNLQIFPGDRLVIGRRAVFDHTVQLERAVVPLNQISGALERYGRASKLLNESMTDAGIDEGTRKGILERLLDFSLSTLTDESGDDFDPKALRNLFRELTTPDEESRGDEAP